MKQLSTICLCAFFFIGTHSYSIAAAPERATTAVSEVPVAALRSSYPPKGTVWVRAKIVQQTDDDTYLIQDRTGQITLFLPTDKLLSLELHPGMEILIYGTVDISPVNPGKNEFYAERVLLPPKTEIVD
jgi:uncharacterized protein YdeI (BOF family)